MYKKMNRQPEFEAVELHIEGMLDPDNPWVFLAKNLPWADLEEAYAKQFKPAGAGEEPHSVRTAMGALILKQILGVSDRGLVQAVTENPYLQHFLGFHGFQTEAPFSHSQMACFRTRFTPEVIAAFNEKVIQLAQQKDGTNVEDTPAPTAPVAHPPPNPPPSPEEPPPEDDPPKNKGTLLLDATCAPADIPYPTDLRLVNEARELSEKLLDEARVLGGASWPRPRTYPNVCRQRYLQIVKHPKCKAGKRRMALRLLLNALRRNLAFIDACGDVLPAKSREYVNVMRTLHDQQREMLDTNTHRVEHRIVNLHQPHVRPIVRGKAGRETEFGAKFTVSVEDGYTRLEHFSWEAYGEAGDLPAACEAYKARTGHWPEAVLADKLFRNRENLAWCAERGIRLSGPRLGRPPKETDVSVLRQQLADSAARNAVEGKFGQCKRRLGLDRVMARGKAHSETVIRVALLASNLIRWLRDKAIALLRLFFQPCFFRHPWLHRDPFMTAA